jgi:hypothetical protein
VNILQKRVFKKLGLEDLGDEGMMSLARVKECPDCKSQLLMGRNGKGERFTFCPGCVRTVEFITASRFQGVKVGPHEN